MKKYIITIAFLFIGRGQAAQNFNLGQRIVAVRVNLCGDFYSESYENYETALQKAQNTACQNRCSTIAASWCIHKRQLSFHINPNAETLRQLSHREYKPLLYVWNNQNYRFELWEPRHLVHYA